MVDALAAAHIPSLRVWRSGMVQWLSLLLLSLGILVLFPVEAHADALADLEAPFRSALQSGRFGWALLLIFLAGLATSLTPCVYPMIAITVSIFGARQAKSRWESAVLSTFFVLGMACLFTPLGLVAALTGGVFGSALASPVVLVVLASLFVVMALSMFGAFDINLPSGLRNRLAQAGGVGKKGAFVLGLVSALVAAPCTGPVLAFLLTWVGASGNATFGALSLFVYALGLGTLFWWVGTFAMALPKSGRWLEWIKSVFGIVMLVMAGYYVRDLVPLPWPEQRTMPWLGISVAIAVAGVALGAVHLSFYAKQKTVLARKALGVLLATGGVLSVLMWLQALPPGAHIQWEHDIEAAQARATSSGMPLLVDFGASWCGACGELDQHTFSDPRVVAASQAFVALRVDLSPGEDTPDKRALLDSYDQKGLPLVVLHRADGKEYKRFTAFVEADVFLAALQEASKP